MLLVAQESQKQMKTPLSPTPPPHKMISSKWAIINRLQDYQPAFQKSLAHNILCAVPTGPGGECTVSFYS